MPKANINGSGLYYEEHGQGEPLILIQGFAGNQIAWFFQIRAFEKYFRVITFDSRSIGKSDVSPVPLTIPLLVEDVIGLMDYLKIDKANILGLSLGGLIAQSIAIRYPERVMKLILGSTLPATEVQYVLPDIKDMMQEQTLKDVSGIMNRVISIAFNKRRYRYIIKLLSRSRLESEYSDYLRQMQSLEHFSTLDKLQQIRASTLVITGSGDRLVSPQCSELIASRIPHSKLIIVKGGSHAFFVEMRGRFNREVLRFLLEGNYQS